MNALVQKAFSRNVRPSRQRCGEVSASSEGALGIAPYNPRWNQDSDYKQGSLLATLEDACSYRVIAKTG